MGTATAHGGRMELPTGSALDPFLAALHVAIRLEEEGLWFYTLNARRMKNPRGRAAFHVLVREESLHLGRLRAELEDVHAALRSTPDSARADAPPERDLTTNPIFSHGRTLTDPAADEREVLRLGIGIGWDAYNFLRERGEGAADSWSRRLFAAFADGERLHYETLVEAYETIVAGSLRPPSTTGRPV